MLYDLLYAAAEIASASNLTGGASGMAFYCPGRSENSADAVAEGMGKAVGRAPCAVFLG
ncbi:MAG: hypothetical protein KIG25_02130 [Eubacteriales bacterium]|nr:hypothetical protein [Eubacteriales bacterium]